MYWYFYRCNKYLFYIFSDDDLFDKRRMLSFLEYFFSALVAFSPAERAKVAGPGTAGDANSLNQPPAQWEIDEELRLL